MRHILCYGDSNTWGYTPGTGERHAPDVRWTGVLRRLLGEGWEVLEEGMNGRTTVFDNPMSQGRNGSAYLLTCLETHKPLDLVILMLGTNDLLQSRSPEQAAERLEQFLSGISLDRSKILVIAPPPVKWGAWVPSQQLIDDSRTFARLCQTLTEQLGIRFADAGKWDIPLAYDGVHFTEQGHRAFAAGLLEELK